MEGSRSSEEDQLMKAIEFYQSGLQRYMERNDEFKMLHSLNKLSRYPIKVSHLKETGVGRTVNLLVKMEGKVGEEATSLINKWKRMVEKEKEEQDSSEETSQSSPLNNSDESNSKYKQRKSESDEEPTKNGKSHDEKENRSTERHRSSKDHRSNDHRKHESNDRNKHKSSHDKKDNRHKDENEKHSSRTEKGDKSPKENDKKREKERDRNSQRDRSHRENEDKSRKEKERSSHKDKSERKVKEEKSRKEEKSHKETKKNEDSDRKHKDSKSSSSNSNKKDQTSRPKNHVTEISSESGTSFADALGMMEFPSKPKKSDKKDSSSSSKRHRSDETSETSAREKKHDKKESSSNSKHEKEPKSSDPSKKDKKSVKKDSSGHRKNEVSSGSGTSFEDALGMAEKPKTEKKAVKRERAVVYDTEFSSGSGTSFEAALGMMEIPKKKRKLTDRPVERSPSPVEDNSPVLPLPTEPLEKLNIVALLPSITPNYRPLPVVDSKHSFNDQETLNSFMTNKHQRTKIYSGNKSSYTKVPSLFDICTQLLQVHIDAIEGTGGVPYSILKPVLEKATPTQLLRLEYYNSYLTEDSDELWKLHCQKDFKRENRMECETWREMYTRCTEEREARLQTLTANIKLSREKSVPVKQTKIAYIDPPNRNLSRRGAKHLPAAPMAKAKVESIVRQSKSSSDVVVTHQGRVARGSSSSSAAPSPASVSSQAKIKKVAPLMAKSLSAFKNRFKR